MMYLSKGAAAVPANDGIFRVSYRGKLYALGPILAELWKQAIPRPQTAPRGQESLIRRMEASGIVSTTEETGALAVYRLLSGCILCPEEGLHLPSRKRDRRLWTWITQAGLRLMPCELIRLEEQKLLPAPALLGENGRQELTEAIYTTATILDGILETNMEHSPARDATVRALLRLLRARRLVLV